MPEIAEKQPLDRLEEVLDSQVSLLNTAAEEHSVLQNAVIARDWGSLEQALQRLQVRSAELEALEGARRDAYRRLRESCGLNDGDTFYELLTRLDNAPRSRLADKYRSLKVAVMRLSGRNSTLADYVSSSRDSLEEVLSELFPQRKGTIYRQSGAAAAREGSAFVVNQTL
ncbi:MAG: flagellar export chaperone FlgN [Spirochaetales bacterium]